MLRFLPSVLLCALVLAAHWSSVCWARSEHPEGCMFDRIAKESGPLPTIILQDAPKQSGGRTFQAHTVSTGDAWAPMRIKTSIEPFKPESSACANWSEGPNVKNIFNQEVPCIRKYEVPKHAEYLAGEVLQRAIKLHTDRLLVKPLSGKIKVPAFDSNNFCSYFQVPADHQSNGFSDADMMLYVAVSPFGNGYVYSTAAPCATIADGRPVVGGLVLHPRYLSLQQLNVRTAAHDIAHALGFSYSNMNAKGMITNTNVRGDQRPVVNSPNVKQAAQAHYKCDKIIAMELENGEPGSNEATKAEMLSHWERRTAKDELMAYPLTQRSDKFLGLYTALTLAAFEDLGYYKAKYDMAEPMTWGHNAGCRFTNQKCKENMENGKPLPAEFCKSETKENFVCTSDRQSIGKCTLADHFKGPFSALGRSVFGTHSSVSSTAQRDDFLTDFCPVVSSMYSCHWKFYDSDVLLESLEGEQAVCLDGDSLKKNGRKDGEDMHAICAAVRCDNKKVTVRFKDQKTFVECPEGTSIEPTFSGYKSGNVKCPKYEEVCTVDAYGRSLVTPDASEVPAWKQEEKEHEETTEATAISTASKAGTE